MKSTVFFHQDNPVGIFPLAVGNVLLLKRGGLASRHPRKMPIDGKVDLIRKA